MKIKITFANFTINADLNNTPTAREIYNSLPVEAKVNIWGDEIYFDIPVHKGLEDNAREEVENGDIAYWPSGPAFCMFFGPTPVSNNENPRAYSPVNVFGKIKGDLSVLKTVENGEKIAVDKLLM